MDMEVDRSAKAYAKDEIIINAPGKRIYTILADINNWPGWQHTIKSAHLNGEPSEGAEFQWNAGGLRIVSKLHTVKPYSEFGWTGRMWWIRAIHNWTIREKNGGCVVTVEESLKGFLSGLMKKTLVQGMRKSLEELKAAAEEGEDVTTTTGP